MSSDFKSTLLTVVENCQNAQEARQRTEAEQHGVTPEEWEKIQHATAQAQESASERVANVASCGLGFPPWVHKRIVTGTLDETPVTRIMARWLTLEHPFLVLSGGVGVGKTLGALAVMLEHGAVTAVESPMLARRMNPIDEQFGLLNMSAYQMILDDLGTENPTEYWLSSLDMFINRRMAYGRTVVTTNLSARDMAKRYGSRIMSRLRDCGHYAAVPNKPLRQRQTSWPTG